MVQEFGAYDDEFQHYRVQEFQECGFPEWTPVMSTLKFLVFIGSEFCRIGGTLNGLIFDVDNIMVKDSPQVITGLKSVRADPVHPVVFKGIKLKGSLNHVDVNDLVNNQVRLFLIK